MDEYLKRFAAAHLRSTVQFGPELNPAHIITADRRIDGRELKQKIAADFLDGVIKSALDLPGNCYKAVRETSYVLFDMGIDHAVTIGNVAVEERLSFTTTSTSIEEDFYCGFDPTVEANAHAWLTLDTGQVIDPTILASHAYHKKGIELQVEDAIYVSGEPTPWAVEHHPFVTGFAYHLLVVAHPLDQSYDRYVQWMRHHAIYKSRWERAKF